MHASTARWLGAAAAVWLGLAVDAAAQTQTELDKLVPAQVGTDDAFGRHVSVAGTTALIGAVFDDDRGDAAGAAYVYDAATGQLRQKIFAGDPPGERAARRGHLRLVGLPSTPGACSSAPPARRRTASSRARPT